MVADPLVQKSQARSVPTLRFAPSLYLVGLLAVLGAILVVALSPRLDTDMWWHLQVGKYIATHHAVPSKDFMSFTFAGHAWTDHEWLAELSMYGLYSLAGLWGPIVAFALLICATFLLVYATMRERGIHPVLGLFVTSACFVASSASWGPRIQMATLFFVSLYSLTLHRFVVTRNRRLLFVFPGAMLLWANIHGGFALGLALLVITLVGEGLNRATRNESALTLSELKMLAVTFAATFAVTMVNPNTYRQLLYPLTFVLPNAYTNLIEESASPSFHMPVMMVFEAMLLLLIAAFVIGRPSLNWTHLFVVLAFTHLALSQVRNVPLWAVLVGPLLAYYLQSAAPRLREQFPQFSYRRRPVEGRLGGVLNVALLALVFVVYLVEGSRFDNATALRHAETQNYPAGAVAYLRSHHLPQRVFVSYAWGGYLLWNLFPRYRDYMDSRADTLFDTRILHGYLELYAASPDWKLVVRKYRIQGVLVERNAPIVQVLSQNRGWRLAYRDHIAALLVQRHEST
jgi:hypothetical protein